jgi:1-acyl-sn-glycerol-3-phosphate acyltransferase
MIKHINNPFFLSLRFILKRFIKPVVFIFKGYRIEGKKNLPKKRKPCMIICNHAAFSDSIYIICSLKPRFAVCGAKPKYFSTFVKRNIMQLANVMKVKNQGQFVTDCGKLLAAGNILLIYPQMGRFPAELHEFKTWAAEVALNNRVPVIPCYIYGTSTGHKGKKKLFVGEAIEPAGDPESLTRRFFAEIENLQKQSLKGG